MGLSPFQSGVKRLFDLIGALLGLAALWWLIVLAWLLATIDTGQNGFFMQKRVGRYGRLFRIIKIRTMRNLTGLNTTVTTLDDRRITRLGGCFRRLKIDELPQLLNVLIGQMSFVGPRPDVPGFADQLHGESRLILDVRPGITGPATIKYRDEEQLLAGQDDPEQYNRDVLFPDKVRINMNYIENWSLCNDLRYIGQTILNR